MNNNTFYAVQAEVDYRQGRVQDQWRPVRRNRRKGTVGRRGTGRAGRR